MIVAGFVAFMMPTQSTVAKYFIINELNSEFCRMLLYKPTVDLFPLIIVGCRRCFEFAECLFLVTFFIIISNLHALSCVLYNASAEVNV